MISSRRAGDCVTFRPRLDAQRKKSALPPAKAERPKNKRPGSEAGPEKAPWLRLQAATLYQRIAARGQPLSDLFKMIAEEIEVVHP